MEYLDLVPPATRDEAYGLRVYELYHDSFSGIWDLFTRGLTGLCTGNDRPLTMDELADITSDVVSRPEDYDGADIPMLSPGTSLSFKARSMESPLNARHFRSYTLRGLFSYHTQNQSAEEPGDIAVSVCNTLAENGIIPIKATDRKGRPAILLTGATMERAHKDFIMELSVRVITKLISEVIFEPDENGILPMDLLEAIKETR